MASLNAAGFPTVRRAWSRRASRREDGEVAEVGHQRGRLSNRLDRRVEGPGDRPVHDALDGSDAHAAAERLGEVLRLERSRATEGIVEHRALDGATRGRRQAVRELRDRRESDARALVDAFDPSREEPEGFGQLSGLAGAREEHLVVPAGGRVRIASAMSDQPTPSERPSPAASRRPPAIRAAVASATGSPSAAMARSAAPIACSFAMRDRLVLARSRPAASRFTTRSGRRWPEDRSARPAGLWPGGRARRRARRPA